MCVCVRAVIGKTALKLQVKLLWARESHAKRVKSENGGKQRAHEMLRHVGVPCPASMTCLSSGWITPEGS